MPNNLRFPTKCNVYIRGPEGSTNQVQNFMNIDGRMEEIYFEKKDNIRMEEFIRNAVIFYRTKNWLSEYFSDVT